MPDETDGGLEKASSSGGWDQFAENERRFGIKTDYDENIYTTKIDKSHPKYNERLANAEKVARSIERSVATTSHVAEERIMDFAGSNDQAGDEEDKYVFFLSPEQREYPPECPRLALGAFGRGGDMYVCGVFVCTRSRELTSSLPALL